MLILAVDLEFIVEHVVLHRSEPIALHVEDDGHRPVVHERDLHPNSEDA